MKRSVLVVDDERIFRVMTEEALTREGFEVKTAATLARAHSELRGSTPDVLVVDRRLPDGDGLSLIHSTRELGSAAPLVIVVTAYGEVVNAVDALRAGATDYLTKPVQLPDLVVKLNKALEARGLRDQLALARSHPPRPALSQCPSEAERKLQQQLRRVAQSALTPVFLLGPSGAGKQCAAEALHAMSHPALPDAPFVEVNCVTLARERALSELFGHERGNLRDAPAPGRGLVELADGGTLFLDEIAGLGEQAQAMLLKFLDTMRFRRVGGTRELEVRLRVVAATNQDPQRLVAEGTLRADLWHRLSVFTVELPPLRQRRDDIPQLALDFARYFGERVKKRPMRLSQAALSRLAGYDYPGNIRELRNIIERAVILAQGAELGASDIVLPARSAPSAADEPRGFFGVQIEPEAGPPALATVERAYIARVLEHLEGKRTQAAAQLGISYPTFLKRLRELDLE